MPWRRAPETRGDRAALAHEAGMGRISLVSVLAGTLVAYGAFAVLLALTAAVADAVGFDTELAGTDWRELGTAGGVVVAVVLLLCYLFGGYVAGRMARRAGVTNGFAVFVLSLVVAIGVTGLVNLFTDGDEILSDLRAIGVPTSSREWGDVGTVAGIGSLLAMLLGAVLGGGLGERWHGKLLARALDPSVGPEAEARAAAERARAELAERERALHEADGRTVVVPETGPDGGERTLVQQDGAEPVVPGGDEGARAPARDETAVPERDVGATGHEPNIIRRER